MVLFQGVHTPKYAKKGRQKILYGTTQIHYSILVLSYMTIFIIAHIKSQHSQTNILRHIASNANTFHNSEDGWQVESYRNYVSHRPLKLSGIAKLASYLSQKKGIVARCKGTTIWFLWGGGGGAGRLKWAGEIFLPIFIAGEFFSPAPKLFLLNRWGGGAGGGGGGGQHPCSSFTRFFFRIFLFSQKYFLFMMRKVISKV